ncbi:MAG TPA: SDR family NAD(P)-dependent oxidoreductase [Burkholderiaceae bacterium]|nr:SDR family NAD(P)-dependent oxidoreductase [Burkholderiaceae bacterium]
MKRASPEFPSNAIAIVGVAGRFPGARDLQAFWQNIREGVESLTEFSDAELDAAGVAAALYRNPRYVRRGTVLEEAEWFDASFFGFSPREAQILDPQHRVFLECAWEALEHAGYAAGSIDQSVGVFAGASMNTYLHSQVARDPALMAAVGGYQLMIGNDKDFLCTRVSYKLDLRGPSMTVQTACSTSLVAVQMACRSLAQNECDLALAGGVSVTYPLRGGYLYQDGMILSPDGRCRPFDASAQGTRPGAGCGIVVLKRLDAALSDGDTVHAVIRGAAVNNDGSAKAGYTAPSVDGQLEAVVTAQSLAGVHPRSVGYIEAHGTATPLGDPIEIAALTRAFRAATGDTGFCRLGSLKANLGHLDAAAGVAGLIKAVLALQHREYPPLVNFVRPNPQLALEDSPFTASATAAPWPEGDAPRRAGVSSFGIGGTNAHVVLEEAPPVPAAVPCAGPSLLVLSARSAAALDAASARLADHLRREPGQSLRDVAWTLQAGRRAFAYRRAVVVDDAADAVERLADPRQAPVRSSVHDGGDRPVAFLFSGQGSQFPGMGAELHAADAVFRETLDHCAQRLREPLGCDLREQMFALSDGSINQTRFAQPALFAFEVALARVWQQRGVEPVAMLGHSIGEFAAAHLAGVLSLDDALALVAERGRLMQAMPPGAMAAVPLGVDELAPWLALSRGSVEIAAINAPGMCTVAGPNDALDTWLGQLTAAGVDARRLQTSHAFHSAMMEPMLAEFVEAVARVQLCAPQRPYVSNVTGDWITAAQATSPAYWAEHLRRTVMFGEGVRRLAANPSWHLLEIGPGNALASLARIGIGRDGARRVTESLGPIRRGRKDPRCLLEASARLWLAGVPLRWAALHDGMPPRRVPLPTYPFERRHFGIEVKADPAVPRGGGGEPPSAITAPAPAAVRSDDRTAASQAGVRRSDDPADWCYEPTWLRMPWNDPAAARLAGGWLILGGDAAMSRRLAAGVGFAGGDGVQVAFGDQFARRDARSFVVRQGSADDLAAVLRCLRTDGIDASGALWLADAGAVGGTSAAVGGLHRGLVALAEGMGPTPDKPIFVVVATSNGQSVSGEACDAVMASALGPVLALPHETPGLEMRVVDLAPDSPEHIVDRLVAEAADAGGAPLVAWRHGRRWARRYERLRVPATQSPAVARDEVVLITGGLGGIGLAIAARLARSGARLMLTGRSPLPPRESWNAALTDPQVPDRQRHALAALLAIEQAGGEVEAIAADSADEAAMAGAIARMLARWGRIDAVVHAAGVPGTGKMSSLKRDADVEAVLAPKVRGLDVLVRLLGDRPLRWVALMGSINGVVGAPGASDYAAANLYLDGFVESQRRPAAWRRVVAMDWWAWRDVGMAAHLEVPAPHRRAWDAHLRDAIPTETGIDLFSRLLAAPHVRVVIAPFDLVRICELAEGRGDPHATADAPDADQASHGAAPDGEPAAVPYSPPGASRTAVKEGNDSGAIAATGGSIEAQIAAIWIELLGVDEVQPNDNFFELGGHSLLATRVLARIGDALGVRLALRDVFDSPTVRGLAERVAFLQGADEREEIEF